MKTFIFILLLFGVLICFFGMVGQKNARIKRKKEKNK